MQLQQTALYWIEKNLTTLTAAIEMSSTLNVVGNFSVATNKLTVAAATGNTVIAGTLGVTLDFAVATNKFTVTAANGNTLVAGTLDVTLDFAVATNKFTVAASTGNTLVAGTLDVTSDFDVNSANFTIAAATGNTLCAGTMGITGATTLTGGLVGVDSLRLPVVTGIILATTGTDVAYATAGDQYVIEIIIRYNTTFTGAALLNGPTVGNDNVIYALWNQAGTRVASTSLSGVAIAGADAWQQIAFTAPYEAIPGRYFIGIQGSGTTDNFHALAAGNVPSTQLNTTDQGSFGTVSTLAAVPTAFVADVGPFMYLYT